jgi:hypothetical protein
MIINSHRLFTSRTPICGPANKKGGTVKELNKRLAELLGWTNIVPAGGALLGTPPGGAVNSRGQAAVPDWEGDWRACGPLIGEGRIALDPMASLVSAGGIIERHRDACDQDAAIRRAIVKARILRLERAAAGVTKALKIELP